MSQQHQLRTQVASRPPLDIAVFFNLMSRQITDSYRTLESRVTQLSGELSAEAEQRRQELEEKERLADRLSTLLNALPAAVVVLDYQGVVTQCNPAAKGLLGEPLEGARWVDVIRRAFAPRHDDGHEVSLRDGRRVSIEIRTMENQPGQLILLTDLTETRKLQADLSRAERLTSMGRMVASLAHQVRTPLSAAMLYAGHLCHPNLSDDMRLRCAEKLMSRLTHLEHQVRDMLIFARGETRLAEQIAFSAFIRAFRQVAEPVAQARRCTIHWPDAAPKGLLLCNRDALVGACMNLINNSLDAGAHKIVIGVGVQGDFVELSVEDDGCGFDADLSERLLEAFYTTKPQGTGLGLAVVKAVVAAHRGEFTFKPGAQQGARACLRLPLQAIRQHQD